MKIIFISDELYEKLKVASENYKTNGLEMPDLSVIGEFLKGFKPTSDPCLDCPKKEYRETVNSRR